MAKESAQPVSLQRLAALLPVLVSAQWLTHFQPQLASALNRQIPYHCTYDKRERQHFINQLQLS